MQYLHNGILVNEEKKMKTWETAYQKGFDEGIKKTMDAADSTFGARLKQVRQEAIKEVVEWIKKNKKWEEEHYSGRSIGTPESTGGIIPLTETYYLLSKDKLNAKLKELGYKEG